MTMWIRGDVPRGEVTASSNKEPVSIHRAAQGGSPDQWRRLSIPNW